jgi:mannose-6-phosphate isomerase-like protein (cupin superfamily)
MTRALSTREQVPDGAGFILNLEAGAVRPVHRELFHRDRWASILVAWSEDAYSILSRVPAGGEGPPAHWHDVDQLFYCTTGSLEVRVGQDVVTINPGDLLVIPAGTAHQHRNPGTVEEVHLELIVPGIIPWRPIVNMIDEGEQWEGGCEVVSSQRQQHRPLPGTEGATVLWSTSSDPGADVPWECAEIEVSSSDTVVIPEDLSEGVFFVLEGALETADGLAEQGAYVIGSAGLRVPANRPTRLFLLLPDTVGSLVSSAETTAVAT